ncbi:hypothetical protein AB7C87_05160 [Natrarchaeobius sp. A-rgal3]
MYRPLFVPASEFYDVETRTPLVHPAYQANDSEVREAVATRGEQA